jgi:processive 1,2-diacylglycerol beta-glucosyltransferase
MNIAQPPRILILTVRHGSGHVRTARALEQAFLRLRPEITVEVVDTLVHCAAWFRAYYNSFEIPLKYWPGLWEFIENRQHEGKSTNPKWLYQWGARPLFRFIQAFDPDVLIATEVGLCEMAALHKRQTRAPYALVAIGSVDFDRAWAQPEVDLFTSFPGEISGQLLCAGVPPEKILECGMPVDPAFGGCPDKQTVRERLGVDRNLPLLLVNFGGSGKPKPHKLAVALRQVQQPFQAALVSRGDAKLREVLQRLSAGMSDVRILDWVDNLHEWMAAADLLVGRAGGSTVMEALNSGLPILVFDAPPGDERRAAELIEKRWEAGYWVKNPRDIAPRIDQLLAQPEELERLQNNARRCAHPNAARDGAVAVLRLADARGTNAI